MVVGVGSGGGVQSHFHVKPALGYVRLSWGFANTIQSLR